MTAVTHPQAALLKALLEHVTRFPHLATVNIGHSGDLQIAGERLGIEPANVVLQWAKTLVDPTIMINRVKSSSGDDWTKVDAKGRIGGVAVEVWDSDRNDLYRWVESGVYESQLELDRLVDYVAAGSTERVIS